MPTEKSIGQARHLLTSHSIWCGDQIIKTHWLDKNSELKKEHQCFDGLEVRDVLKLDATYALTQNPEVAVVVDVLANWLEKRHEHGQRLNGFVGNEDIQDLIESALFKLEKASIKEAKPEVYKRPKLEN